ncbi:hypothetical protein PILCRDRAFT_812903 [Piloderma croceum F 1598]|uniref:DUF427 domain-containing protein n=1 Tax=Piloderma croceum (strain F 1598) TaxID=765440 RepID=A0A0C3GEF6_PILCF|nr:hypothetical protein PILCRDRAFT_812903 [Piloderma croceum F 1598]
MVQVTFNGKVIARSDDTVVVENNHYFPIGAVEAEGFSLIESSTRSFCPWKGQAFYYDGSLDGEVVKDIAWYYPEPLPKAKHIKDHVAFYKNKVIIE